jgi:hypothetical protein
MLLPVFSILITPALAILASAFEVVPVFVSILLKVVVSLLAVRGPLIPCLVSAALHALLPLIVAVLRALTPVRSLLRPSRTFAQSRTFCRELRWAIGHCAADHRSRRRARSNSQKISNVARTGPLTWLRARTTSSTLAPVRRGAATAHLVDLPVDVLWPVGRIIARAEKRLILS